MLLLLCLVRGFSVDAQLKAVFSSDTTAGCAPLVVKFKDESTGTPTSWRWELGNGTVSFLKDPAATYFNPGTYTIKLIVANNSGKDSVLKINYITVFATPSVNFVASATTGCYPLAIHFEDQSFPGDGHIIKWEWDFGDGQGDSVAHPNHTYTQAGNFNVSLRVTSSNGCRRTLTRNNYIRLNNGVTATFTSSLPGTCKPPAPVSFTSTAAGTGVLSYLWDFGDGQTSQQINPVHTYSQAGSYNVLLQVKNESGCVDTQLVMNAVTVGDVVPDFTIPAVLCAGTAKTFLNQSLPAPRIVRWDFGDNTYSTDLNPVKLFAVPGNYSVKMVADFGTCLDSVSKVVSVLSAGNISFMADDTANCEAPLRVRFSLDAENVTAATWFFGDGDSSTLLNPEHIYTSEGEFDVRVVFTNTAGCTFTLVRNKYIRIHPPSVQILNFPHEGCIPLPYMPLLVQDGTDSIISYLWDFGDGTSSTLVSPSKIYDQPGTYTVTLIYSTVGGCTDTLIYPAAIRAGNVPVAKLFATPSQVCAFTPVQFTDSSNAAPVDRWLWRFGDGGTSTEQHPTHLYRDTGWFDITLIVWSNGCSDTVTMIDYVNVKPPIAFFKDSTTCDRSSMRWFRDASIGATSWNWDFGDGSKSTEQHPSHEYATPGIYLVSLVVSNDTCEHRYENEIAIVVPDAVFQADDTVVCKGDPVVFSTPTNKANLQYLWSFGDGISVNAGSTVSHVYTQNGIYSVQLVVFDQYGCTDTLMKVQYIRVTGPTARFTTGSVPVCTTIPVNFADSSTSDDGSPLRHWIWEFGDGNSDTLLAGPFHHTYAGSGNFSVSLTVTDQKGCSNKITLPAIVRISKPLVDFISQDTLSCTGQRVQLINRSEGSQLKYLWNTGNGIFSEAVHPEIIYTTEGDYTIRVEATDQYGCKDSLIRETYIRIHNPVAALKVSDSLATCPPLVVKFENLSTNYIAWEWHFGDGTNSRELHPGHFYTSPGNYTAKLVVVSHGGCTDTVLQHITVRGPVGDFTYDDRGGCEPVNVQFTAITSDSTSFVWDFDDGSVAESLDPGIQYTYTRRGSYVPKMILVDPQGCRVPIQGKDTIHVFGVTAQFDPSAAILCDSGLVTFTNNTVANEIITRYEWNFGDGQTSIQRTPVHGYNKQGQYQIQLIATTQSGCTDTAETPVPLQISQTPLISITGDTAACVPALLNIDAALHTRDTGIINWKWDFGNGVTSAVQHPNAVSFNAAGDYAVKVTATNALGCSGTVFRNIEAYPLPLTNASPNIVVCRGTPELISATGALTYQWSPAEGLSCTDCNQTMAIPDSTIMYRVQGLNEFGCILYDSVEVKVQQPFTLNAFEGDTICTGNSVQLDASGADLYNWSPPSGLNDAHIASPMAKPSGSVVYRVIGTDSHHCFSDTAFVPVVVYPYPTVNAGPDLQLAVGSAVTLHPTISTDVLNIKWSPASGLSCATCPEPVAMPKESTTYTIEVSNEAGCAVKDEMILHVFCNNGNLFLPNTFSPNRDGTNEFYYPRGSGVFSIKSFRIFNRWGELIFERSGFQPNDRSKGWDGMHDGQPASQDVYIYTVEILCENRVVLNFKGNVVLIR